MPKTKLSKYFKDNHSGVEFIYLSAQKIAYHKHSHVSVYTLVFVLTGCICLTTNQTKKYYQAQSCFLLPPYLVHALSSQENCELLTICLPKAANFVQENKKQLEKFLQVFAPHAQTYLLKFNFASIFTTFKAKNNIYPLSLHPEIEFCQRYLEKNPQNNLSLNFLAKQVNLDTCYLLKKFKKEIGLTPHQFQIQNRLRKAQHLLQSNLTLTEIALATGFYDQSHFIKFFKAYLNFTPSYYRNQALVKELI